MSTYLDRSIQLLGNDKIQSFKNKVILIAGIGGVGGTALEALARSGFDRFILIDFDMVDESNLNRQILFTNKDVGLNKCVCAERRLKSIYPNIQITSINSKVDTGFFKKFKEKVDFIVDAIDYIPGKLELIKYSLENDIPFISSLGMGNRIDPTKVCITKLNQTTGDPLGKKIRYECRQLGLELNKINVVFSKEEPILKSKTPGSMIMVPSTAGLLIAKYIIEHI